MINNSFSNDISQYIKIEGNCPTQSQITLFGKTDGLNKTAYIDTIRQYKERLSVFHKHPHDKSFVHYIKICKYFNINSSELNINHIEKYFLSTLDHQEDLLINRITLIIINYFKDMENNFRNKYMAEEGYKKKCNYLTKDKFDENNPNPFDLINKALSISEIGYQLKKLNLTSIGKLKHISLFSLILVNKKFLLIVFLMEKKYFFVLHFRYLIWKVNINLKNFSDLLLFDEIDAGLHLSMIRNLMDLIENYFKPKGIKIILTTHSPSTVALAPESSIYLMVKENGKTQKIEKINKTDAIKSLLDGVRSIDISPRHTKYVFTEAEDDKYFYSKILKCLRDELSSEVHIEFIASGRKPSEKIE